MKKSRQSLNQKAMCKPTIMEKNIKDYLHLYLGCKAKVVIAENSLSELPYYFSEDGIYEIDGVMIDFQHECQSIHPILRPLSDMTDEECIEFNTLFKFFVDGTSESYINNRLYVIKDRLIETKGSSPMKVLWLLSKHFDLFGLIEAGLAIDANN